MAEVNAELVDRILRWCGEAGRRVTSATIQRALAPLSWDELLAVKSLLADPPPTRPLGPYALADIARGAPPDVAAEREREGRYRSERDPSDSSAVAPQPARRSTAPGRRAPTPVIRRARDRPPASAVAAPSPQPSIDELRLPEGRRVLERLLRRLGARRRAIAGELARDWVRPDGTQPGEADLVALLEHHGLSRAFEHRERDELLHALRAAGGVRALAAAGLALGVEELEVSLARLGASSEAERIREERRSELRRRTTLSERVRLLLVDERRLADLGILEEFEEDLRRRLPEHMRALRTGDEPLATALRRSLALSGAALDTLTSRFALDLAETRTRAAKSAPHPRVPRRPPTKSRTSPSRKGPTRNVPATGSRRGKGRHRGGPRRGR